MSSLSCPGDNCSAIRHCNSWRIKMQTQKTKEETVCTLKTTRDQGHVQILVAEALRINCSCSANVIISLYQVDMKTVRSSSDYSNGIAQIEVDYIEAGKPVEVLTATVAAQFTMCDPGWRNAINGSVEAKLRMFRQHRNAPWQLHHIMVIQPDLYQGKRPSMYVIQGFANQEDLRGLLDSPGKFHSEYADASAIDRTAYAGDFLRLSQLILGERVAPVEPCVPKPESLVESAPVKTSWLLMLFKRFKKQN